MKMIRTFIGGCAAFLGLTAVHKQPTRQEISEVQRHRKKENLLLINTKPAESFEKISSESAPGRLHPADLTRSRRRGKNRKKPKFSGKKLKYGPIRTMYYYYST